MTSLCRATLVRVLALGICFGLAGAASAANGLEGATVVELIEILQSKGLIDEQERDRLVLKHAAEREEDERLSSVASALTNGWDWYGDFRLRYEAITYGTDENGDTQDNRYRFRYRARFGFNKSVSDRLKLGLRLSTSENEDSIRGANQSLGKDDDFDFDDIRFDRAFAQYDLPEWGGLQTRLVGGKIANPLHWKAGLDRVIWDHDIAPEGGAILFNYPLDERTRLFSNVAYYVIEERSEDVDSKVIAAQLGGETELGGFDLGLRTTMYWWRGLEPDFQSRAIQNGNLPTAFNNEKARIGDVTFKAGTELTPNWPLLFYGTFARNFSADDGSCGLDIPPPGTANTVICSGLAPVSFAVNEESDAYLLGAEIGSSKRYFKLGGAFYKIEANSVISMFTDSDLLDGFTNRQGWTVYGARKLGRLAEFKLALYGSDSIEDTGGAAGPYFFANSLADRIRLQTDLQFEF